MFLEFLHHQKIPRHQKSQKKNEKKNLLMLKFHQKIKKNNPPCQRPRSQDSFQLVMVNRHLHRATLKEMVQLLAPGGVPWGSHPGHHRWGSEPANTMWLRKKKCFFFTDQKKVLKHQKPRI
jgi:hypothetical protein